MISPSKAATARLAGQARGRRDSTSDEQDADHQRDHGGDERGLAAS